MGTIDLGGGRQLIVWGRLKESLLTHVRYRIPHISHLFIIIVPSNFVFIILSQCLAFKDSDRR